MTASHSGDELVALIPRFLTGLDGGEVADPVAVRAAAEVVGLRPEVEDDPDYIVFPFEGDRDALMRKLRPAISRALGKPSGSLKVWFHGPYEIHVSAYSDGVEVWLRPQYSILRLRRVAAAWLAGAEVREWLVDSGFVDDGAEPDPGGAWPRLEDGPVSAFVRTGGQSLASVSFFLEPGVHPPGKPADADDERYAQTVAFLAEELGEEATPGCWLRGSRSFTFVQMRSRTRSVEFNEAPAGKVTVDGHWVDIPTTPDPDPAEATALLSQLAKQRGATLEDALTLLGKAGVIARGAPQRWRHGVVLATPSGVPVRIRLIDNRVASAVVRLCRVRPRRDVPGATMTAAFGEPGPLRMWSFGAMSAWYGGDAGPEGFRYRLVELQDDMRAATEAMRKWLLDGEFLPPLRLADSWRGRVLGAEVSAKVVPASIPSQPLWRVDDRLAWLSRDQVLIADRDSWPDWATGEIAGLRTVPLSAESAAAFLRVVRGWRSPTFDELWQDLTAIGWASPDPDTVEWLVSDDRTDAHVTLRLTSAVSAELTATVDADGTVESWTLTVIRSADEHVVEETTEVFREAWAAATQPAEGGFVVNELESSAGLDGSYLLMVTGTRR